MSWAIWITGLPGSGKSRLARAAARALDAAGSPVTLLELDEIRRVVTPRPTYASAERELVYRGLVLMAALLVESGVPVIVDATAHRRRWRDLARAGIPRFAEVQLECPLDLCQARERARRGGHAPRGIYAAAGRPGASVPGVDVAYEPALAPELTLDTAGNDEAGRVSAVVALARRLDAAARRPAVPGLRERGAPGSALWVTGLPGSGKTTIAGAVAAALEARGVSVRRLDFATVSETLGAGAGDEERAIAHRVLVYAAKLLSDAGLTVIVDATAPRREWRELARTLIPRFAEVQLICPGEICARRERAVRWRLEAGRGTPGDERPEIVIDYEHSLNPDLILDTEVQDCRAAVEQVLVLARRLQAGDVCNPFGHAEEATMRVRDLMTTALTTVSASTPVFDARATMLRDRIRHLLVVDDGRLLGIVTDRDIRLNLPSPATSLSIWEVNHLLSRLTVGEVMTKAVVTVTPDRDAREAARLMVEQKIGALPVLDGGRIAGIVTETDLLRAYAASDMPAEARR